MNENNKNLPAFQEPQFVCPYCGVFARQDWCNVCSFIDRSAEAMKYMFAEYRTSVYSGEQVTLENYNRYVIQHIPQHLKTNFLSEQFVFSKCQSCNNTAVWLEEKMIYPVVSPIPEPNEDLDDEIKALYREARGVYLSSARSAAALLRLCVEKLCTQVGEIGTLNQQIKSLVKKGVPQKIQQALDCCRVIGNNAVHPGKIDIEENPETVLMLFSLINDIAQEIITKPRELKEKYNSLPSGSRDQIEKRDGNQ